MTTAGPATAHDNAADAYLDLLKRCLTRYDGHQIFLGPPLTKPRTMEQIERGRFAHQDADTMVGWPRLDNVRHCVETVLREQVPGDLLEAGVWRGGCCVYMRGILKARAVDDRTVWVADSFAGFPEPDIDRYPDDSVYDSPVAREILDGFGYPIAISLDEVKSRFRSYGLLDSQVRFLAGYFADTLPQAPVERLAVLRLDGDMYQSTLESLEHLYPKLSAGGYCIIDDYSLEGCRKAVEHFREAHGIGEPIEKIDWTGVFWRRTSA
ncbi:macrocin O-methyltransferase [Streptomyces sp. SID7499]|uniref:Macrocin O-methyltransferase n=1 Tax=Streptomyces sp. SID7499 TaxID=2706086 RepID=A0A6G3X8Q0_9ACTN|nr:macrocin O-methyltransferase [Streptomyces sp. SID7499]